MKKLYDEERDTDGYENTVMKHMMAMTAEDLYSKAAIAVELAYRDWQIEQLREALRKVSTNSLTCGCSAIADRVLEQTK